MRECYKRKVLFKRLIAGIFNVHTRRNIFLFKCKSLSLEYLNQTYGFVWLIAKSFFSPWFSCRRPKFAFLLTSVPSETCCLPQAKWFTLYLVNGFLHTRKHWLHVGGPQNHTDIFAKGNNHQVKNHTLNHTDELQRYMFSHPKS